MSYDPNGNLLTVDGPLAGTADTTSFRYDSARQRVGTISPDPDGAGSLKRRAVRLTFRPDGQVSKQELGTVNGTTDPDWAAFLTAETIDLDYDTNSRVRSQKLSGGGSAHALTQLGHDALGRPDCSAVRMNSATFGSLPASACTPGTQGSFGPDRISQIVYDIAGQMTELKTAVGTADAATERTLTYTSNGRLQTLKDAENNLTTYEYDGFDRPKKTRFPVTTQGAGSSSTTDFEELTYDPGGNVTNRRLRDTQNIAYTYDKLNRLTVMAPPNPDPTVTYIYDNLGRLTSAAKPAFGMSLSFTYDALSRNLTQVGPHGTVASQWDVAGRRTRLTWPDGFYVDYDHLVTGEMTKIRENGATSGAGVIATIAYDDLGRRASVTRGNGALTTYGYDPVSRLQTLTDKPSSATWDQTVTFAYNPASQIVTRTGSNDSYAWTGHGSGSTASVADGLNRLSSIGGSAAGYDGGGNLTSDPTSGKSFTYWPSDNALWTASSPWAALSYDPLGRLAFIDSASDTGFAYDGLDMIAEYDGAGTMLARYVHGSGIDQPLVRYDGSGTANKQSLHADERGSITALSYGSPYAPTINRYDEYGKPQSSNIGRFQYTGQMWLGEAGLHHYKARAYSPTFGGRFPQTDPIGYGGGLNLYAYVGNDPVNWTDPLGLTGQRIVLTPCGMMRHGAASDECVVVVTGTRPPRPPSFVGNMATLVGGLTSSVGGLFGGSGAGKPTKSLPLTVLVPCEPTPSQMKGSGEVKYNISEGTFALGLLYSSIEGSFTTTGGYSGFFRTTAKGLFLGSATGVALGQGTSQNLATFSGVNYNVVGALGPISISDNFSTSGSHVGETNAAATPGFGLGVTKSTTELKNVMCPQ